MRRYGGIIVVVLIGNISLKAYTGRKIVGSRCGGASVTSLVRPKFIYEGGTTNG